MGAETKLVDVYRFHFVCSNWKHVLWSLAGGVEQTCWMVRTTTLLWKNRTGFDLIYWVVDTSQKQGINKSVHAMICSILACKARCQISDYFCRWQDILVRRPGRSQGLLYKHRRHCSFGKWVTLFLPWLYNAAKPKPQWFRATIETNLGFFLNFH